MTMPRLPDSLAGYELTFRHATQGVSEVIRALTTLAKESATLGKEHEKIAKHFATVSKDAEELVENLEALKRTAPQQLAALRIYHRRALVELAEAKGEDAMSLFDDDGNEGAIL